MPLDRKETERSVPLQKRLELVSRQCVNCDFCQEKCSFLRKRGKPKNIADSCAHSIEEDWGIAFECSLCGLCAAICPAGVDPSLLLLEMRREAGFCQNMQC